MESPKASDIDLSTLSYMSLKKHLIAMGIPKTQVDACPGKLSLLHLAATFSGAPVVAPAAKPKAVDLNAFLANRGPRPGARQNWFARLFGFEETDYVNTKEGFQLQGDMLLSTASGKSFGIGHFDNPTLCELREAALVELEQEPAALAGRMTIDHWMGDVADAIATHPNAVFQAASQFNCLEFVNPRIKPESGIERYESDRTQGPACSIACGPATVYRNYFAPVAVRDSDGVAETQEGQTAEHQIDNLHDVCALLENQPRGKFYKVSGGYTLATDSGLDGLNKRLKELDCEELKARLRVGVHSDIQVTSSNWGKDLLAKTHYVTQVFCSGCSIAYSRNHVDRWEPFARLILEAAFEATLWAAVRHALKHRGEEWGQTVFLSAVGAGVFGNKMVWVEDAIQKATDRVAAHGVGLDVRVVSYRDIDPALRRLVDNNQKANVPGSAGENEVTEQDSTVTSCQGVTEKLQQRHKM